MLPEAIAVVCAPLASPALGIFRLTDPPGLNLIMGCRRRETFHPHPDVEGGIYTVSGRKGERESRREGTNELTRFRLISCFLQGGFGAKDQGYGHVRMREGQGVEVVDLRKK